MMDDIFSKTLDSTGVTIAFKNLREDPADALTMYWQGKCLIGEGVLSVSDDVPPH